MFDFKEQSTSIRYLLLVLPDKFQLMFDFKEQSTLLNALLGISACLRRAAAWTWSDEIRLTAKDFTPHSCPRRYAP